VERERKMDKQSTIRSIRSSYKIDQVENGWTVSTGDGNMFVFADARELAEWFCMIVGVPVTGKKEQDDPLESEIRKLVKTYNIVSEDVEQRFVTNHIRT
jgi:hypothetical protein